MKHWRIVGKMEAQGDDSDLDWWTFKVEEAAA